MAARRSALIYGAGGGWNLPSLLSRCAFEVDVVTCSPYLYRTGRHCRNVERRQHVPDVLERALALSRERNYDWIIAADEQTLVELRRTPRLTSSERLEIAPVRTEHDLSHLGSKIHAADRLRSAHVNAPEAIAVADPQSAARAATGLGYPVMVKRDEGCAGAGVRRADDEEGLARALAELGGFPLLVQRVVEGTVTGITGVFRNGVPMHVTVATELEMVTRFGPSSARRYWPSGRTPQVLTELAELGRVFGLNGFAIISAVDALDGSGRHYFEVDARPSAWVGEGRQVGDDPVPRLRLGWDSGVPLSPADLGSSRLASADVGWFRRLPRRELLSNRWGVWSSFPWECPDAWLMAAKLLATGRP